MYTSNRPENWSQGKTIYEHTFKVSAKFCNRKPNASESRTFGGAGGTVGVRSHAKRGRFRGLLSMVLWGNSTTLCVSIHTKRNQRKFTSTENNTKNSYWVKDEKRSQKWDNFRKILKAESHLGLISCISFSPIKDWNRFEKRNRKAVMRGEGGESNRS